MSQQGSPGKHLTPSHWFLHFGPQFSFLQVHGTAQPEVKTSIVNSKNLIVFTIVKIGGFMFSNLFKKEKKMKDNYSETISLELIKKNEDNLIAIISEDDIRTRAYFLWENSDKVGNSEDYWFRAEQELLKESVE